MTESMIDDATPYVPHPGEYIREELDARGMQQRDLAYVLGVPEQAVSMIVAGKRGISPDMAKALGVAFGVDPELFANLQTAYDMSRAEEPDPGVAQRARLSSAYPVREMLRRCWVNAIDPDELEQEMADFFEVANSNELPHMAHAAKKSESGYGHTTPEQLAWFFRVRQIARGVICEGYSEEKLLASLLRLRACASEPSEARNVPRILADCGIRFIVVESLPKARVDGVCFWLDSDKPVIGMSLFHDRIDNFWFVLRHEIEHVLQRDGQTKPIIDAVLEGDSASESNSALPPEERRANAAAAHFCVPKEQIDKFIARKSPFFSERDTVAFARRNNIHPGIVVGQIQNRTQRWNLLRKYLVKIRHHVAPAAILDGWGQIAPVVEKG
jgi:HTH-type transcriptional regulator / antitoxin HigA